MRTWTKGIFDGYWTNSNPFDFLLLNDCLRRSLMSVLYANRKNSGVVESVSKRVWDHFHRTRVYCHDGWLASTVAIGPRKHLPKELRDCNSKDCQSDCPGCRGEFVFRSRVVVRHRFRCFGSILKETSGTLSLSSDFLFKYCQRTRGYEHN